MIVSSIVAMAHGGVIGIDNQLPWHLPADLKHFKAVTMSKPIIMGRKTFESIGRPLPGRQNIVLTRDDAWSYDNVDVCSGLDQALEIAAKNEAAEVMIIGGAQIYALALPKTQKLYVTEVDLSIEGDAFFPDFSAAEWRETSRESHPTADDKPAYAFVTYVRR